MQISSSKNTQTTRFPVRRDPKAEHRAQEDTFVPASGKSTPRLLGGVALNFAVGALPVVGTVGSGKFVYQSSGYGSPVEPMMGAIGMMANVVGTCASFVGEWRIAAPMLGLSGLAFAGLAQK